MVKCEQDVVLVVQVRGEEDLGLMEGERVMNKAIGLLKYGSKFNREINISNYTSGNA